MRKKVKHLENLDKIVQREYVKVISMYFNKLLKIFKDDLKGIQLFGSVAKGVAKPLHTAESDIDMIILIEKLPPLQERMLLQIELTKKFGLISIAQGIFMTPQELAQHVKAKAGWLLEALIDGITLFDPQEILKESRERLLKELKEKGVERTEYGWVWPLKAGEIINL